MPFKYPGVPIHNNMSEWCTYLSARYLANSKAYHTVAGAAIGDTLMTIILLCFLSDINPYEFILYVLKHKNEAKIKPLDFLPWKLKAIIPSLPAHRKMHFWGPVPPTAALET